MYFLSLKNKSKKIKFVTIRQESGKDTIRVCTSIKYLKDNNS